ncbi:MAG: ATP-binding cassette domain-containing protein, partial [Deltaproteobacteria bacterium]|nr:ATP-binding cassette domain-containing protein [Deltaproteobacteria bacterium]
MSAILEVEELVVDIPVAAGMLHPVRDVSFHVSRGETLCIVGESGCGKSLSALAIMGLLPRTAIRKAKRLDFGGHPLLSFSEREMSDIRGNRMSMIFQDPMTTLNPSYTIGNQLEEPILRHRYKVSRREARDRAVFLLDKVGIPAAESRLGQYPHQLSGGLRQRVMIAMALMCEPELLIADEPSTALDVTIQAQILLLIRNLQEEFNIGVILITHDLGVVARVADRVAVMYAGEIVETGAAREVFEHPLHPYTQGLLDCIPVPGKTRPGQHLGSIPGIIPNLIGDLRGCTFHDRCTFAQEACTVDIDLHSIGPGRAYRCILPPEVEARK